MAAILSRPQCVEDQVWVPYIGRTSTGKLKIRIIENYSCKALRNSVSSWPVLSLVLQIDRKNTWHLLPKKLSLFWEQTFDFIIDTRSFDVTNPTIQMVVGVRGWPCYSSDTIYLTKWAPKWVYDNLSCKSCVKSAILKNIVNWLEFEKQKKKCIYL